MLAMHGSQSDILGELKKRGLFLVTDLILANLGVKSLLCLASTCSTYRQLFKVSCAIISTGHSTLNFKESRIARRRVKREQAWLRGIVSSSLLSDTPGQMVTCLALTEGTLAFR